MLRAFTLALCIASALLAGPASRLYRQARRAEKAGDDLRAYTLLIRAADANPKNTKYRVEAERLRVRAAETLAGLDRLKDAIALDPNNRYLQARLEARKEDAADSEGAPAPPSDAEIRAAERARGPLELKPKPGWYNFHLRGNARDIYEQVFRVFGLDVVFDSEYTPGPPFRFEIGDVDFHQAAHALTTVTGTFFVPLRRDVALVAKDTQQKRSSTEPMMVALLSIPYAMSVEEVNEIGKAVQQALEIKRLVVDPNRRQVLVRDTVPKVQLAKALYAELSRKRGEVILDIDLLSTSRSSLTKFGLLLQQDFSAVNQSPATLNLGGGQTLFGIQLANADLAASWMRSEARFLSRSRLRATDGLAASLHVGNHYPILNASFSPIVITQQIQNLQNSGQLIQPFPSFTFEDLGLVLKVTPRVHTSREVSLTIEAEFRALSGASFNSIPVIDNRKVTCTARLLEGQTSIISGLTQMQGTRTSSGVAGLAEIPILGRFFRQDTWQLDQNELVITITPHVTVLPPGDQFAQHTFYSGTETSPQSPFGS